MPLQNGKDTHSPFAIIDVGSNSVRLVIYKVHLNQLMPLVNHSVMCGLGQTDQAGNMLPERMDHALQTMKHHTTLCYELGVQDISILATAAVRDAPNQLIFSEAIKEICHITPRILSGKEEAIFAAQGVLHAFSDVTGIVADLGGGSLEVTELENGYIRGTLSTSLGPLRLLSASLSERQMIIEHSFKNITMAYKGPTPTLYLVGGSARALAKMHMLDTRYPLEVMHGYTISGKEASFYFTRIRKMPRDAFDIYSGRIRRRQEVLPLSALILGKLIEFLKPQQVIISSAGIREGFCYSKHVNLEEDADRLTPSAQFLAHPQERFPIPVKHIVQWICPLLTASVFHTPFYHRILSALCALSDYGWDYSSDYRSEKVFNEVLHSPWLKATHDERLTLCFALAVLHGSKPRSSFTKELLPLLKPEAHQFALQAGALLRLYNTLGEGVPTTWQSYHLSRQNGCFILSVPKRLPGRDLKAALKLVEVTFQIPTQVKEY